MSWGHTARLHAVGTTAARVTHPLQILTCAISVQNQTTEYYYFVFFQLQQQDASQAIHGSNPRLHQF
jgi:hypothetical protein